ncbi:MAG: hypothetical protein A2Z20_00490 [Bdellovibrionales bacterium RBG_16_40_8]|nr:MAG: hypothetical protein A2Z20_00490 [Bdellovibrionales bacterium RBG_16_40_8]
MSKHQKHIWHFTVLEDHLDSFSHMNHATYLQLFEQARWELVTERGYGLKKILATQIGPTILEAHIHYNRELLLRENITIETECTEYRRKIGKIFQRMINSQGQEAATLEIKLGLFDLKTRKLIAPTNEWLHAIDAESL